MLYVKASTNTILYCVLIEFPEQDIDAWLGVLDVANQNWAGLTPGVDVDWGRAVDQHTVELYRRLRKAIVDAVLTRQEPVPNLKYIKPVVIAMWNREKVGVDVVSRLLKNVQLQNENFGPQPYLYDRYTKLLLLNSHRLHALLMIYSDLIDGKIRDFATYRARMNAVHLSFRQSVGNVGKALAIQRPIDDVEMTDSGGIHVGQTFTSPPDRLKFFESKAGAELRMDKGQDHHRIDTGMSRWCALCDESVTLEGKEPAHIGSKSDYACLECGYVVLCKKQKWSKNKIFGVDDRTDYRHDVKMQQDKNDKTKLDDRISCWEIWHTVLEINAMHKKLTRPALVTNHCNTYLYVTRIQLAVFMM